MENNSLRNSKEYGLNPNSRLWKPVKLGDKIIEHRVGMAPLTRFRALGHVPQDMCVEYYEQRASKGGLLVSEATFIAHEAGGYPHAPGIHSAEQIAGWKKVTDAVHAKGGVIYCQLWALGRANGGALPDVKVVAPSAIAQPDGPVPEAMTEEDIKRYIEHYKHAAKCAIEAGFDGCELHGAHGYLLDQFLQTSSNIRTDAYGGSLENRARFLLEALEAVVSVIGGTRTAVRISPFAEFQGMGQDESPFDTWGYVCREIKRRVPNLAYVSVVDNRFGGASEEKNLSCDQFRAIFRGMDTSNISQLAAECHTVFPDPSPEHPTVFYSASGYSASDAEKASERTGDIIAYGRIFIANPDLPYRLKNGLELNPYDRSTFYTNDKEGYTTYSVAGPDTKRFVPSPVA